MRKLTFRFLLAFIICIGSGICFGYIAAAIDNDSIANFDASIIGFIQGMETPWLTIIMKVFTWIGSAYVVAPIALIGFVVLYFKLHYRQQASLLVIVVIGTTLLNSLLKLYFRRERPEIHRIVDINGFSFPSGHSMMAFSLYAIIAYIVWRNVKTTTNHVLLVLLTAFMISMIGASRIYLGVHYPSDIVGGYAASTIWLTIVISFYGYFQDKRKRREDVTIESVH